MLISYGHGTSTKRYSSSESANESFKKQSWLTKTLKYTNRLGKEACCRRGEPDSMRRYDMPRPSLRSRSYRRIKKRLPGGAFITHYFKREPSKAKCSRCGKVLHGVASVRPARLKKLAKTKKTTSRAFGGNMCPSCTKEVLRERARAAGAKG